MTKDQKEIVRLRRLVAMIAVAHIDMDPASEDDLTNLLCDHPVEFCGGCGEQFTDEEILAGITFCDKCSEESGSEEGP